MLLQHVLAGEGFVALVAAVALHPWRKERRVKTRQAKKRNAPRDVGPTGVDDLVPLQVADAVEDSTADLAGMDVPVWQVSRPEEN